MSFFGVGGDLTTAGGASAEIDLFRIGNFKGYFKNEIYAFTSMWGLNVPGNDIDAESYLKVRPASFPAGTVFGWDITPDPEYTGVNGYLHMSYGNYDNSPGRIPSRKVNTLSALSLEFDWVLAGDTGVGVLAECYLSAAQTPAGDYPKVCEIGFFLKSPPEYVAYASSLPSVGTFVSNGVTWNVVQGSGPNNVPYFIAYRNTFANYKGTISFKAYFDLLIQTGKITGDEWFNGFALGAEPYNGVGTFAINKFIPTYLDGLIPVYNRLLNNTFDSDASWAGFWFSGKSVASGKAVFSATPQYDGIHQPVTLIPGKYYELKYTVTDRTVGSITGTFEGGTARLGTTRSTNATFVERLLANEGNNEFYLMPRSSAGATLKVDNVSLMGPYDTAVVGGA